MISRLSLLSSLKPCLYSKCSRKLVGCRTFGLKELIVCFLSQCRFASLSITKQLSCFSFASEDVSQRTLCSGSDWAHKRFVRGSGEVWPLVVSSTSRQ